MIHQAEQFTFNWEKAEADRALYDQWDRNIAVDAHNWTDDAHAMCWALGCSDWNYWRSLPKYQTSHWTEVYVSLRANLQPGQHMPTWAEVFPPVAKEVIQQRRAIAERWATDIQKAWLNLQPCPISCEGLEGPDRIRCQDLLQYAFQIANMRAENFALPRPSAEAPSEGGSPQSHETQTHENKDH
jgi:hypothetical protein